MSESLLCIAFPAQRKYGIFLRTAVAGGAAALDLTVDALEDLRTAAEEALDTLIGETENPRERVLCDLYPAPRGGVTLHMRLSSRAGVPAPAGSVTAAILGTLMQEVTLLEDERGCTGVRMTLRTQGEAHGCPRS